jgi:hypothetical protein
MRGVIYERIGIVTHELLGARVVGGGQRAWWLCRGIERY